MEESYWKDLQSFKIHAHFGEIGQDRRKNIHLGKIPGYDQNLVCEEVFRSY